MLYSTMQDVPLTLTSILCHGANIHGDRVVITATDDGYRQVNYQEFGARVAQFANGLRSLGVRPSDRVATFMWNNQEHLEAYFAIPCMGAVLHTLNIRLSDDQIEFIAYDAEDTVVIVDMSLPSSWQGAAADGDDAHGGCSRRRRHLGAGNGRQRRGPLRRAAG